MFSTIPIQNFPFRELVEIITAFDHFKDASESISWCLRVMNLVRRFAEKIFMLDNLQSQVRCRIRNDKAVQILEETFQRVIEEVNFSYQTRFSVAPIL